MICLSSADLCVTDTNKFSSSSCSFALRIESWKSSQHNHHTYENFQLLVFRFLVEYFNNVFNQIELFHKIVYEMHFRLTTG